LAAPRCWPGGLEGGAWCTPRARPTGHPGRFHKERQQPRGPHLARRARGLLWVPRGGARGHPASAPAAARAPCRAGRWRAAARPAAARGRRPPAAPPSRPSAAGSRAGSGPRLQPPAACRCGQPCAGRGAPGRAAALLLLPS
jgi:hypothetical protein